MSDIGICRIFSSYSNRICCKSLNSSLYCRDNWVGCTCCSSNLSFNYISIMSLLIIFIYENILFMMFFQSISFHLLYKINSFNFIFNSLIDMIYIIDLLSKGHHNWINIEHIFNKILATLESHYKDYNRNSM